MSKVNEISKLEFMGKLERLTEKLSFTEIEVKKSIKKQSSMKSSLVLEVRGLISLLFSRDIYNPKSDLSYSEQFDAFYSSNLGAQARLKIEKSNARISRDIKNRILDYRANYQDDSFPERAEDMIDNHKVEIESCHELDFMILGDEFKESKLEVVLNSMTLNEYVFLTENYSGLKFMLSKLSKSDRARAWKVREYLDELVLNSYWQERGYSVITPWDVIEHHSENHKTISDLNEKVNELSAKIRNFKVAHQAVIDDKSYVEPTKSEIERNIREEIEKGISLTNEATLRANLLSLIDFYKGCEDTEIAIKLNKKLAFMTLNRTFIDKLDQELFSVSAKKRKLSTAMMQLKKSSSYNATFSSVVAESLGKLLADQHVRAISYTSWIDGFKYSIFNLDGKFNAYSEKSLIIAMISSLLLDDKKSIVERATARIIFTSLVEPELSMYSSEIAEFMSMDIYELTNCEVADMQEKFIRDITKLEDSIVFDIDRAVDSLLNDIESEEAKQNTIEQLNNDFMSYETPDSGFEEIKKES